MHKQGKDRATGRRKGFLSAFSYCRTDGVHAVRDLNDTSQDGRICVRVCRLWEHRDEGRDAEALCLHMLLGGSWYPCYYLHTTEYWSPWNNSIHLRVTDLALLLK